jgi:hypothetical protein
MTSAVTAQEIKVVKDQVQYENCKYNSHVTSAVTKEEIECNVKSGLSKDKI